MTSEFDDDRFIRVRVSVIENGERRIKELEEEVKSRFDEAQGSHVAWGKLKYESDRRIRELEKSIADHFTNEHLAGDGPEIDRWKRKVAELEAELAKAKLQIEEQRLTIEGGEDIQALDAEFEWQRTIAHLRGCLKAISELEECNAYEAITLAWAELKEGK